MYFPGEFRDTLQNPTTICRKQIHLVVITRFPIFPSSRTFFKMVFYHGIGLLAIDDTPSCVRTYCPRPKPWKIAECTAAAVSACNKKPTEKQLIDGSGGGPIPKQIAHNLILFCSRLNSLPNWPGRLSWRPLPMHCKNKTLKELHPRKRGTQKKPDIIPAN
jgi:hypothetical protein